MLKPDVIVILGGGITEQGTLPEHAIDRCKKGFQLYKKYKCKILCSGAYPGRLKTVPKQREAKLMRNCLIKKGVPKKAISTETKSKDTFGNAFFCEQIIKKKKWNKLIVVFSEFGAERIKYVFDLVFGPEYHIVFRHAEHGHLPLIAEKEGFILELTKFFADKIKQGDNKAIKKLLYSEHPYYSKNPPNTIEELENIMKRELNLK